MKYLLIFLLLLCGCSPLKQLQRTQNKESTVVDNTKVAVRDTIIQKEQQVVMQTVIEYYPQIDTVYLDRPVKQPIKSITKTVVETKAEGVAIRDSVVQNNIETAVSENVTEKIVEKPPAAISWIKWAVIVLVLVLIIVIVIKLW
ncbi:hypothetical protein [Bacteroides sp.]|uniref:hypothetical protein n=1 Tax=Bacteroides sp. TaxID=29523 RepID=UPI0026202957|nr:hypothetical protein [Bacteroides sp.]MDD3039514.1 hypothetical protein [Bacteroides sp.]